MKTHLIPLIAAGALAAQLTIAAGEKPGPAAYVTIETGRLRVEIAGDRAWTISRIVHQDKVITDRAGFYGTVFSPEGGRWIGTGHNEGGVEKVTSAILTVDGKPCDLKDQAIYSGRRAELRKQSMMGSIRLEATYIVTADSVQEQHRYEATEDVKIGTLYGFMHPFLPGTTEWLAEKIDGTILEGGFDNKGGHRVKEDVKWTAVHDPAHRWVALAWYPKPLTGQGLKTFYWDKTVYHKLYNQLYSHSAVPAGGKFEAAMILRFAESDTAAWKAQAQALATETRQRHERGDFPF
jgi:hypothetical protein